MSPTVRLDGPVCVGVDVGGTFTDAVVTDGLATWRAKAPTTAEDVSRGVLDAVSLAATRAGSSLDELLPAVGRFGLGTTAVTNVLASRAGLAVGLLTTKGFEEAVPLARGRRLNDEEGWLTRPPEIVDRRRIIGLDERVDRDGVVVRPLDPEEVAEAVRELVEERGVQSLAISFLWSFRNPAHEELAVSVARERFPDLPVTAGAALHPAIREFERTTFAVLNAITAGAFAGVESLAADLAARGLSVPLLLVHSAGGSISVREARRLPISLAESGPAAGVAAAVAVASASGRANVVTCDMGGTSFDVSVVTDGQPARRTRGELMGVWTALPLVDVESIGAGGGSIGWVDARGMLRVGPRSAGARPGPACYGRGGTDATVTDALLVLGYLAPDRFLGGDMPLDRDAAVAVCEGLGGRLGLDAVETAWGIRRLALAGMVKAVRSRLAVRGLDPRTHAIVSYGGCGSLFTPDIAASLGAPLVLVPELASVLSAFGAATADVRRERLQAVLSPMPVAPQLVEKVCAELRTGVLDDLAADGVATADRSVTFEVDLRFKRQTWELPVPLPDGPVDDAAIARLTEAFRDEYAKRYGRGSLVLGTPIEAVGVRAVGHGRTLAASLDAGRGGAVAEGTIATPAGSRRVRVGRLADGERDVAVYDGSGLVPGHRIDGPALVDGMDTTVWIPDGAVLRVDTHGTLAVETAAAAVPEVV